jgi:hypothetical protein
MSTPVSPVEHKLPQRSGTVSSSFTRRTSMSDDEAIPDTDSSQVSQGHSYAFRFRADPPYNPPPRGREATAANLA